MLWVLVNVSSKVSQLDMELDAHYENPLVICNKDFMRFLNCRVSLHLYNQ